MLTCHNLSASYDGRTLFEGVGFSLFAGALMLVRGANGAGKTTLLRTLAGLRNAESGGIYWDGLPIDEQRDFGQHVQYLGHKSALHPHMTVEQHLNHWAFQYNSETALPVALYEWRLGALLDMRVEHLSAGWQRRLAMARLLLCPGSVWILDEPLAHLDREGAYICERLMVSRVNQGGIVIASTHMEMEINDPLMLELGDWVTDSLYVEGA